MDETRKKLLLELGFSPKAITVLNGNLNMGELAGASVTEQHQGKCGDIMILHLIINKNKIKDARFEYVGCAGLQACASALTEMIKDKSLEEAGQIEVNDIINYLQGIPLQKYECAEISRDTLRKAIKKWQN